MDNPLRHITKRRPSLQMILIGISILFLLMPLGGVYFLRIYESALIRQTESELISQAAFVSALYKHTVEQTLREQDRPLTTYGLPEPSLSKKNKSHHLQPVLPTLDLAKDPLYPTRPNPKTVQQKLDNTANIAGKKILPILKDAQRITLSGIKVLDYHGLVTAGQSERGLSFAHSKEFQDARKGKAVRLMRNRQLKQSLRNRIAPKPSTLNSFSRNSQINVYVALPIILKERLIGVVWVNRTPTDLAKTFYGKRMELLWTGIGLLLLMLLITAFTSWTIRRPIRALVKKTRMVTEGDPEGLEPIENPVTSELAELSKSVTTMARTIQNRAQYIQDFAAHVSHEFKTPLTAIQGAVELLDVHLETMPKAQQARFLNNIQKDTDRLKQLVDRLLELARADMSEPLYSRTSLSQILNHLYAEYSDKRMTITHKANTDLVTQDIIIDIPQDVLFAVLGHLIENSIQVGATEVTIQTDITSDKNNRNQLTLSLNDNGPGISEGNQKQLFTPFFTTNREDGGTGLGLCISRSLLERQGGNIQFKASSSNTPGACFQLLLPLTTS